MVVWVNQLINGLGFVGPILLMAASLSMPLAAVRVLNVALGATFALTAIAGVLVSRTLGAAGLIAVCVVLPPALFTVMEVTVLRPQRVRVRDAEMGSFAATLGVGFVITAVAALISHSDDMTLPPQQLRIDTVIHLGSIQIPVVSIVVFAVAVAVALGWGLILRATALGKLFRALASNRYLASATGVRTDRIALQAWMLSGLFAGFATFLVMIAARSANAESGETYLLTPFAAVIAGGMGSMRGAVIASFFFGLAQSFAVATTPGPGLQSVVVFGLLFLILLVRPSGIIADAAGRREY